ncbi:urease accessory protein UreE [Pseudahrensia aquimaris]|uniref:Urease accessory protein UreE n=1 Tax=Pseudahrensia aquimaris TaxID=744461 RepID=A0ABW3FC69_9HYPH
MSLPRAIAVSAKADGAVDTVTLDETGRHRRRLRMTSDGGEDFMLDLEETRLLRDGEGLVLEDGRVIAVKAKPENLYAVFGRDARHLLSLAWQLGNRHLAAEIHHDHILIRRDPVIGEMLENLGAQVRPVEAAFNPEGGAYDGVGHGGHAHDHGHQHG